MRKLRKSSLFCNSCTEQTPEMIEEEMNRKLFPRICIGHVALFITGVAILIMEFTE